MPNYDVTSPDGRTFRVTAPEGATHDQIIGYAQEHMPKAVPDIYNSTGAAIGRGAVAGIGGLPADTLSFFLNHNIVPTLAHELFPKQVPAVDVHLPLTTSWLEKNLPDIAAAKAHPTAQKISEIAAPFILPGVGGAIGEGATTAKGELLASKSGRYLPGAMGRAEQSVSEIGPVSDVKMSQLGDTMVADLRGRFDQMVKNRAAAADVAEQKLGGFWKNNPEAVKAARKVAFREASKSINKFSQENALGKIISGNLSPYSDVERVAHSTIPDAAFKDAQRVRDLRGLLGGDQRQVEKYAGEYAATKIQSAIDSVKPPIGKPRLPGSTIANMARVAEKWQSANAGWLNETPVTKAAVQFSVDQLKAAARAASNTRAAAVGAGVLGALYEMGANAGYWIRYAASKL